LLRYPRTATATATARLMSCLVEAHASLKVERLTGGDGDDRGSSQNWINGSTCTHNWLLELGPIVGNVGQRGNGINIP